MERLLAHSDRRRKELSDGEEPFFIEDCIGEDIILVNYIKKEKTLWIANFSLATIEIIINCRGSNFTKTILGRTIRSLRNLPIPLHICDMAMLDNQCRFLSITRPCIDVIYPKYDASNTADRVKIGILSTKAGGSMIYLTNGFHDSVFIRVDFKETYTIFKCLPKQFLFEEIQHSDISVGNRHLTAGMIIKLRARDQSLSFDGPEYLEYNSDMSDEDDFDRGAEMRLFDRFLCPKSRIIQSLMNQTE